MGVGESAQNANLLDSAVSELTAITGQKAVVTRAKKSISNFKIREGMPVGCRVTLRGQMMYEFLDRLINLAIPRIRDFRGVPTRSFDGRGNYTLGITEQTIFPEIDYDRVDQFRGMDVTIVTSAETDEESAELLKQIGMPFRR
jgi:large subunit ribosomal protein L5